MNHKLLIYVDNKLRKLIVKKNIITAKYVIDTYRIIMFATESINASNVLIISYRYIRLKWRIDRDQLWTYVDVSIGGFSE